MVRLAAKVVKDFLNAQSASSWGTSAGGTRTVRWPSTIATAVSTAAFRSAWPWAWEVIVRISKVTLVVCAFCSFEVFFISFFLSFLFFWDQLLFYHNLYPSADRPLARPRRKQATVTKLLLLQATQKKFVRLSVQPGLHSSSDLCVGWKLATFQLFFQSVRAKDLSAPLYCQMAGLTDTHSDSIKLCYKFVCLIQNICSKDVR